jgi:hypothetical protein
MAATRGLTAASVDDELLNLLLDDPDWVAAQFAALTADMGPGRRGGLANLERPSTRPTPAAEGTSAPTRPVSADAGLSARRRKSGQRGPPTRPR